jgi:hypothetical protein
MIYVRITEGLGNQLFKYACAFAVSKKSNDKIEIDLSGYAFRPRGYMLDKMNITGSVGDFPVPKNDKKLTRAFTKILKMKKLNASGKCKIVAESKDTQMQFAPYDFTYQKNIYIDGYWQNPKYFEQYKAELTSEFSIKEGIISQTALNLKQKIANENSVAIHIRRGDYCAEWIIDEGYYLEAVDYIKEKLKNPRFYIFCEDYEYAKGFSQKIGSSTIIRDISYFEDIEEFCLISACHNQIIANSTFSWWGAYLNQNLDAIIIAPDYKQWSGDYYPDSWIKIKV